MSASTQAHGQSFSYDDEDVSFSDQDLDDDGADDDHDESFQRLSSILASLQKQAEAAVSTPAITHPDGSAPEVASEIGAAPRTVSDVAGDIVGATAKAALAELRGSMRSPTPTLQMLAGLAISRRNSPAPKSDCSEYPLQAFSPTHRRSFSPAPRSSARSSVLGMVRRRSGMPSERKSVEFTNLEKDLEGLLTEFLDDRLDAELDGERDTMFRWVWVYMLGGGIVWLVVGLFLGLGCTSCAETCTMI